MALEIIPGITRKKVLNWSMIYAWVLWWLRQSRICLQCRRPRFDPWVRKIPWRREWLPTLVFLPGESHGRGAWSPTIPGQWRLGHDWATSTFAFTVYALLYPGWGLEGGITVVPGRATGMETWCMFPLFCCLFLGGGEEGSVPVINFCAKAEEKEIWSCTRDSSGRGVVLGQLWVKMEEEMASELQVTQCTTWAESQPERAGRRASDRQPGFLEQLCKAVVGQPV